MENQELQCLKDISKSKNWKMEIKEKKVPVDLIQLGTLLRIADAVEDFSRIQLEIQQKLNYLTLENNKLKTETYSLRKRLASSKGRITRLQNRIELLDNDSL